MEQLIGCELAGRFRLEAILGKGGGGAVFAATQLSVMRRCAVKVLQAGEGGRDGELAAARRERFRAEARAMSRLAHPHTAVLYDYGEDEGRGLYYLALEFLEGMDLQAFVARHGPRPLAEAVHIACQMAGSLGEAHDQGLVHRDVKPQNVVILERGEDARFVKLIDFGIAKSLAPDANTGPGLTRAGCVVGTPQYMAPEQIQGLPLDARCDQYALAVTLYKILTGINPFAGGSTFETARNHVETTPMPVGHHLPAPGVPLAFEMAMLRALSKSPRDRFEDIREFAAALRTSLAQASPADAATYAALLEDPRKLIRPPGLRPSPPSPDDSPRPPAPAPEGPRGENTGTVLPVATAAQAGGWTRRLKSWLGAHHGS